MSDSTYVQARNLYAFAFSMLGQCSWYGRWDGGVIVRPSNLTLLSIAYIAISRWTATEENHTILFVMSWDYALSLVSCSKRTAISEYRQNPFQGAIKHTIMQGTSRLLAQAPYVLPPFVIGTLCSTLSTLRDFEDGHFYSLCCYVMGIEEERIL